MKYENLAELLYLQKKTTNINFNCAAASRLSMDFQKGMEADETEENRLTRNI